MTKTYAQIHHLFLDTSNPILLQTSSLAIFDTNLHAIWSQSYGSHISQHTMVNITHNNYYDDGKSSLMMTKVEKVITRVKQENSKEA